MPATHGETHCRSAHTSHEINVYKPVDSFLCPRLLQNICEEIHISWPKYSNMASDWLAGHPPANRTISQLICMFKWSCLVIQDTGFPTLTHWGRVTHICVGKQTIIGSDNGLSPGRRQAIIWTNDGILLIGPLRTNINEISIKILTFSFTKIRLKVTSAKWRLFCLGLNVLNG